MALDIIVVRSLCDCPLANTKDLTICGLYETLCLRGYHYSKAWVTAIQLIGRHDADV